MKMVINGYGFVDELEPTEKQVKLRNDIDESIMVAVLTMHEYSQAAVRGVKVPEKIEYDQNKLNRIRVMICELYGLPDVYL